MSYYAVNPVSPIFISVISNECEISQWSFFKIPHTRFGMTNTLWGIIITITAFQTE